MTGAPNGGAGALTSEPPRLAILERVLRGPTALFRGIGARVYFLGEILRAFSEPRTYMPLVVQQMRNIGVDSMPLAGTVAAFVGAVTAYQTVYQLFPGVQLSAVGWIVRQSVVLELGPLLTALVLAGRVGARMTAEIGTMRVTEQIDALETLAYDPVAYLVEPRLIASVIMLPVVTVLAIATGIVAGGVMVVTATQVRLMDYTAGLHLTFTTFQVVYALIKATLFGGAIALICAYEGYVAEAGAEGVGRSTARAVVLTSVVILVLDALTALYLAPKLS
ncbi:MAG TPA: ABC transporter permease [Gemmatimonadaceae bacterium]|nr:ABC transporter permease [Gemmatimonadaceae bacterium]